MFPSCNEIKLYSWARYISTYNFLHIANYSFVHNAHVKIDYRKPITYNTFNIPIQGPTVG